MLKDLKVMKKSTGGIIIPDYSKEKPSEGEIMAVAGELTEDGKLKPMHVKKGIKFFLENGQVQKLN